MYSSDGEILQAFTFGYIMKIKIVSNSFLGQNFTRSVRVIKFETNLKATKFDHDSKIQNEVESFRFIFIFKSEN